MAVLLAVSASGTEEPLKPPRPVQRLGAAAGYVSIGGVTKPVVAAAATAPIEVNLGRLPAGRLHFAAGIPAQTSADDVAVACEAREAGRASEPLSTLHLEVGRWDEASVAIDAPEGGRVLLRCRGTASVPVAWAQPLFVPAVSAMPPLIVLVSLDTLRADHVSGFGAPAGATPALERLGAEGIRFTETTAEATWTVPSHFALFYSHLFGFPAPERPMQGLAQLLADHGYVTAALTGGGFMGAYFRFHYGFDHFAEYDARDTDGSDVRLLPYVLNDARAWIERFADAPLFLFLHTYAIHQVTPVEARWAAAHRAWKAFVPTPAQIETARLFYGNLVGETDRVLGPFLDALRVLAAERPVLLLVVSDHGEAFGEHGNFRHGADGKQITLHDEVVRVPLIVWGPSLVPAGLVSRRATMLSDVAPSILSAVGARIPSSMGGGSLRADQVPIWETNAAPRRPYDAAVSWAPRGWSMRTPSYKLILEQPNSTTPHVELYAIRGDPAQRRNLALRLPRAVATLRRRLGRTITTLTGARSDGGALPSCPLCGERQMDQFWTRSVDAPGAVSGPGIDEATRERLRALGYAEP